MEKRILVVEDDRDLSQLLCVHLKDLGFDVDVAFDGYAALNKITLNEYDLLILDIMLPGIDGLEICRKVRVNKTAYIPILMLTARSSEQDRVLGLELGADDYLTKPFSIKELLARVKAIFRRTNAMPDTTMPKAKKSLQSGVMYIDPGRRIVTLNESNVSLTAREFDLLYHFASNPGQVYTRAQLLDQVWGYSHSGYDHTVNSHINRLRAKIEHDPAKPHYIITVWGVGYKFTESTWNNSLSL